MDSGRNSKPPKDNLLVEVNGIIKNNIYTNIEEPINEIKNRIELINIDYKIPYNEKYMLQIDVFKNTDAASINNDIINELKSTALLLSRITSYKNNNKLNSFANSFIERYGEQEP